MAKKDVFICDNCSKISAEVSEGSDLPYFHGWRSLNAFEFKASTSFRHQTMQKHFCSSHCMLFFLERFINEQEEKLHGGAPELHAIAQT